MVLNGILGALAGLSLLLLLWQWTAARRFPLHQRRAGNNSHAPDNQRPHPAPSATARGVTLLKPLKGADENTAMCLRSWLTQDYAGPVQALFGVMAPDDPAAAVVRQLLAEFPDADAQLIICPEPLGTNAKVAQLIQLERLAKHELLCVSDADVCAPADFLTEAVNLLGPGVDGNPRPTPPTETEEGAALVNCFYRLANPSTLAMQCEAVAINADFWSQVLQSCSFKPMDFSLGAAMVTRRTELAGIGGFTAIKDCLADDYQLGNRIVRRDNTKRIEICPVVVECWDAPMGWRAVWKHQLRWARTIRVCQPTPYFFSILSNPTLWPLVWAMTAHSHRVLLFLVVALIVRVLLTADLQRCLRGKPDSGKLKNATAGAPPDVGSGTWLAPVKDLMQVAVWAAAFAGNTIEWRGRRMKVRRDGTLVETKPSN